MSDKNLVIFSSLIYLSSLIAIYNPKNLISQINSSYILYANTEIYDSQSDLGKHLRASADLEPNTIIAKFDGILTQDVNNRHSKWIGKDISGKDKFIIVETSAVYVNHSCDPNCKVNTKDWSVITIRNISKNEPLTISYNNKEDFGDLVWNNEWNFKCFCGSTNCEKYISGWKKKEILSQLSR